MQDLGAEARAGDGAGDALLRIGEQLERARDRRLGAAPTALAERPPSGFSTASASQSLVFGGGLAARARGGSLPPSVIVIITEISAMPSPMQWWTRAISALPPS